ncbi:tetraspanin-1-like [Tubulanus polymorphus]|uniref:tetraspanin-1-like n=1 Tax=Tubulanus polymorphus TaxID=672921 RepID=UPI003DA3DE4B
MASAFFVDDWVIDNFRSALVVTPSGGSRLPNQGEGRTLVGGGLAIAGMYPAAQSTHRAMSPGIFGFRLRKYRLPDRIKMCTATFAKYFLCAFNLVFFLVGGALLGLGIAMYFDSTIVSTVINMIPVTGNDSIISLLASSIYVLIAVGAFIFVFGFFGCCGAYRENKLCLSIYAILVALVVILQIAAGILAGIYSQDAIPAIKTKLKAVIVTDYTGSWSGNAASLFVETLQIQLECCGVDSYTDLQNATNWNRGSKQVPESCCFLSNKASVPPSYPNPVNSSCPEYPTTSNSYYQTSCISLITSYVSKYSTWVIGVAIGLVLLELICIGAAIFLKNSGEKAV